ncbi:site-specific integrase [Ereboglobus sp. PH5-10]|uniref:site-specific integrase n=1 Tax=Ereboglobus sp. PH5-10 TaxID=2940629 RepID=UPI0024060353|nr:site-specific integrase [Ereboglobus sp. PH5-10]
MKTQTASNFTVKPFKNRNGVTSWRVSGWLHGLRVRKNFKNKQDAFVERGALDLKIMQTQSSLRPVTTSLSEAQVREAEILFQKFAGKPRTLAFYADYGLAHYKEPISQISLADAVKVYLETRRDDEKHNVIGKRQLKTIESEFAELQRWFPTQNLADLTTDLLKTYINRGNLARPQVHPARKTVNLRYGHLFTFFRFAVVTKEWLAKNPLVKIARYKLEHSRGSAPTFTAEKTAELMAYVESIHDGALVPYYALCLFAGIRPSVQDGEISRLPAKDVRLDTNTIHIEPEVSKVDMKRNIDIQPNLAAWLEAYPLDKFPIIHKSLPRSRVAIAKQFGLSHDVMRHTFISMHIAKFRSMGDTALQAGNSEHIIRRHYLNVKSVKEADAFFNIMPRLRGKPQTKAEANAKTANATETNNNTVAVALASTPEAVALPVTA